MLQEMKEKEMKVQKFAKKNNIEICTPDIDKLWEYGRCMAEPDYSCGVPQFLNLHAALSNPQSVKYDQITIDNPVFNCLPNDPRFPNGIPVKTSNW